ncbi:hypothetical protein L6452_44106 [Arctium lappa]|uniref:Uncharacterized protein n=1 Tax=Arctium lappa TaxID=4217 RepID=A0ACB8XF55_ARCLA|nr:hypothetical protein L6452_44106 [Arctium lappa]
MAVDVAVVDEAVVLAVVSVGLLVVLSPLSCRCRCTYMPFSGEMLPATVSLTSLESSEGREVYMTNGNVGKKEKVGE